MKYLTIKESFCEIDFEVDREHGRYYNQPLCQHSIIAAFGNRLTDIYSRNLGLEFCVCPKHGIFKKSLNPTTLAPLK